MKKKYMTPWSELVYAASKESFMDNASQVDIEGDDTYDVTESTDGTGSDGQQIVIGARGESSWGDDMW